MPFPLRAMPCGQRGFAPLLPLGSVHLRLKPPELPTGNLESLFSFCPWPCLLVWTQSDIVPTPQTPPHTTPSLYSRHGFSWSSCPSFTEPRPPARLGPPVGLRAWVRACAGPLPQKARTEGENRNALEVFSTARPNRASRLS